MSLRPPAHPSRAQRESAASCRQSLPLHLGCPAFARSVANFEIRSVGVRNSSTKGAAMILVTGAAGNNGQAAVWELSRQSVKVRALVRDASKATAISDLANVEVVQGDMQKPEDGDDERQATSGERAGDRSERRFQVEVRRHASPSP